MSRTAAGSTRRARRRGQAMVEFAIVGPVAIGLLTGILSGAWLFFQNSSLADGARGGARMASIETSLYAKNPSGRYCESAMPQTIEQAVAQNAVQLRVNPATLCAAPCPPGCTPTQLVQPWDASRVNIIVDASPNLSNPTTVTVTLKYVAHGLAPPLSVTYNMISASTMPALRG